MNRRHNELARLAVAMLGAIMGLLLAGLLLPLTTIGPYPLTYEGLAHADPGLGPAAAVMIPGVLGFLIAVTAWDLIVERRPPWRRPPAASRRPGSRWAFPVATFSTIIVGQLVKARFDFTKLVVNDADTEYRVVIQPMELALSLVLSLGTFLVVFLLAALTAEAIGARRSPEADAQTTT